MHLWLLLATSWWTVLGAPPSPDDTECALLLSGPPRSSAYDYTINLLKGNFGYEGQQQCITYEAVNQAYIEARQRILVSQPKGEWKPEHYASVGELVLDISTNLARRYGLTYEEIEKGLPLIDTSRTLLREVCPPVFSHVECRAGKYRRLDGLCNNLQHPTWGATNAPFQRLLSPLFADGMNAPRVSRSGHDLPLSRVVSRTMHPDEGFHDHAGTVMVIAWGQFMDHDYTLTGTPLDPVSRNDPEECCKRPSHLKHPYCNEIRIPDDDYFYRLFGVKCIDFVRGFPSPRPGCRLGSRVPFNTLTGAIDGNTVYGVTEKFARKLRTGYGGLLRMNPVFQEYGLKDLLPLKLDIPDEGCTRPNKNMYCFEAGEIRVNEQLVLTVMHTLMAREHNRCAQALAQVNPHWDDETLYQESRRITIAQIQHITYNEFLPILLGKDVMEKFGLVLEKDGYWDGYDPHVNPDVLASFAAAAYRFGHSLLPTAVERWSKAHKFIASKRLSDLIRRPYDLYRAGVLDEYVMGLMNQVAQAMDDSITQEVTNHLFKKVGARFGMDLVSFNMQRGREFGLPGYMEFRKFCGLPGAETFDGLFGSMPNATVRKYSSIFERPDDVDLWSGGVSERALPGSMLGPTFACIIATQFSYSRRGDRFWFELPNQPSSFTPPQLAELRKSRLARVICDNTDIIDTVQLYPMVLPDHELNPRVPCRSGILPSIDFSKWAEPAPSSYHAAHATHAAHAEGYVTEAIINYTRSEINSSVAPVEAGAGVEADTSSRNANLDEHKRQVPDRDALLKYVYKSTGPGKKSTGAAANSLRRRRRRSPEPLVVESSLKAPLIVDYETSHGPHSDRTPPLWLDARSTPEQVKSSHLADFNIETLHGGVLASDDDTPPSPPATAPAPAPAPTARAPSGRDDRSLEVATGDVSTSSDSSDSTEDSTEYTSREKYNTNDDSSQNDKESLEDVREYPRAETPRTDRSGEQDEPNTPRITTEYDHDRRKHNVTETSSEITDDYPRGNEPYYVPEKVQSHFKEIPNKKIQDVDLGDFSYEKIQINKEGNVVPATDTDTDNHEDTSTEYVSTVKPVTDNNKKYDELNARSDEVNDDGSRELTHIDDGEVKPVVEINADTEDGSEEDRSDVSVEGVAGSSEAGDDETTPPSRLVDRDGDDGRDVKQQFERVPLNYSHDDTPNHGTTTHGDTSPPAEYDQHLDLKFDDISIKLPDIKLPEDILAYSYPKPPSTVPTDTDDDDADDDGGTKRRFYHYSDEQRDDDSKDEDKPRSRHPGRATLRSTYDRLRTHERQVEDDKGEGEEEEEEEDLYEKFVKERFGKRSERLRDGRSRGDPALRSRLHRLLQRTKDSALARDGNYMWALEYTDKL